MNITPDDLIRGAMTLKDEAAFLDATLITSVAPQAAYCMQHMKNRRDSLRLCADHLEQQAIAMRAAA